MKKFQEIFEPGIPSDCHSMPTMTQQHFAPECDAHSMMERFAKTGDPGLLGNRSIGNYGDFSNVPDYQSALNAVNKAQTSFMDLPALIRAKFNHDPGTLLAFLQDRNNMPEAIELGIISPEIAEAYTNTVKKAAEPTKPLPDKEAKI
nr:MAG: internal scaffolding protein [Microviridae sp.]